MNELLKKDISSLTREEMRKITDALTTQILDEFSHHIHNGIYAKTQTMMTYNSNRIEGSTLSEYHTYSLSKGQQKTHPNPFGVR